MRAKRLSREALALPPTHFLILSLLTFFILLSFVLSTLPPVSNGFGVDGALTDVPYESSILFSFLVTVYVIFYNFANDLNNPFRGVYNVSRSSAASHLLQMKWLLVNHPSLQKQQHVDEKGDLVQTFVTSEEVDNEATTTTAETGRTMTITTPIIDFEDATGDIRDIMKREDLMVW